MLEMQTWGHRCRGSNLIPRGTINDWETSLPGPRASSAGIRSQMEAHIHTPI